MNTFDQTVKLIEEVEKDRQKLLFTFDFKGADLLLKKEESYSADALELAKNPSDYDKLYSVAPASKYQDIIEAWNKCEANRLELLKSLQLHEIIKYDFTWLQQTKFNNIKQSSAAILNSFIGKTTQSDDINFILKFQEKVEFFKHYSMADRIKQIVNCNLSNFSNTEFINLYNDYLYNICPDEAAIAGKKFISIATRSQLDEWYEELKFYEWKLRVFEDDIKKRELELCSPVGQKILKLKRFVHKIYLKI